MTTLTIYPRRYTARKQVGEPHVSRGDGDVVLLFEDLTNSRVNTLTWGFRKRVIDCALRLFGNFDRWLEDQQRNPDVSGYNVLFLDDTLTYISTGTRQMQPMNWLSLLSEGDGKTSKPSIRFELTEDVSRNKKTVDIIQKWCSHPRGVEDLAQTLFVLFGTAYRTMK